MRKLRHREVKWLVQIWKWDQVLIFGETFPKSLLSSNSTHSISCFSINLPHRLWFALILKGNVFMQFLCQVLFLLYFYLFYVIACLTLIMENDSIFTSFLWRLSSVGRAHGSYPWCQWFNPISRYPEIRCLCIRIFFLSFFLWYLK